MFPKISGAVLALTLASFLVPASQPDVPKNKPADHLVVLLDTSLSQRGEPYQASLKKLKTLLEGESKRFNVLTFDVAGHWLEAKEWLKNDPANRGKAMETLEKIQPEGATDIGGALTKLATASFITKDTTIHAVLISDGQATWGERDVAGLVADFQSRCSFPVHFTCFSPGGAPIDLFKALEKAEATPKEKKDRPSARVIFDKFLAQAAPQVKLLEGKNGEHVKMLLKMLADADFDVPAPKTGISKSEWPDAYRKAMAADSKDIGMFLQEGKRRADAKDPDGMLRALSTIVELHPIDPDASRLVGYRLLDLKQPYHALHLFGDVQRRRPNEPHSYRDLARSLEDAGKHGLAAVYYEIVLAGEWNAKFTTSLKEVVQEEYAHMMRDAIRRKAVSNKLMDHFGERLEGIDTKKLQADLRVTISWNTDETDVDLWVIEPDGTKCFFGHQKTKNGGELTQDVTQGYGPERYQMIKAGPGEYAIKVHFYSGPRLKQVINETHVNVVVRRDAGTPQEVSQRFTVILRNKNDLVEVCRMKYPEK